MNNNVNNNVAMFEKKKTNRLDQDKSKFLTTNKSTAFVGNN